MAFFAAALTFVFIFFSSIVFCDESPRRIVVENISVPPVLDGRADDPCWAGLTEYPIALLNGGTAVVKACVDSGNVYMLIRFKGSGSCKYSRWHWDSARQIYVPGKEKEDVFSIVWSARRDFDRGDIWLWRAALTNPSGVADDYFFTRKNKDDFILRVDEGVNSWRAKYFFAFAGAVVDRFYSRAPSGSAADVKAKGSWRKGEWIVEFSRKLNTRKKDDIDFSKHERLFAVFFSAMPDMNIIDVSRCWIFEIKPGEYEKD